MAHDLSQGKKLKKKEQALPCGALVKEGRRSQHRTGDESSRRLNLEAAA